jgi:hypothetical protein
MADITKAKAGDTFTAQAIAHLERCGLRSPHTIKPKAPGSAGQWVCIDCGYLCQNQIDAHNHAELHNRKQVVRSLGRKGARGKAQFETVTEQHRLAWRNFETGDIEEP